MHLDVCLIIEMCASRFGLGFTHDAIYIFARHMFMHISCILILSFSLFLVVMSLSLSRIDCVWHLSANPLWLGTLLVLGLPLLILSFPSSCLVLWWEGPTGLPWKISETWHSSETPCCSIRLFRHSFPYDHSDSGLRISLWETLDLSHHVYIGVLLQ